MKVNTHYNVSIILILLTFEKLSKTLISSFIDKSKKNFSGKTALQVKPSNIRFNKLSSVYRNF